MKKEKFIPTENEKWAVRLFEENVRLKEANKAMAKALRSARSELIHWVGHDTPSYVKNSTVLNEIRAALKLNRGL